MTKPMTPAEAQGILDAPSYYVQDLIRAVETIAAMTVEEDWRLVSTEQNGGAYETERWTRLVSEWVADEQSHPNNHQPSPPHKGGASSMKEDE